MTPVRSAAAMMLVAALATACSGGGSAARPAVTSSAPAVTASAPGSPPVPASSPAPSGADGAAGVVVAAVGDLVCDPSGAAEPDEPRLCAEQRVSDLVLAQHPAAFLALGDTQYEDGSASAYQQAYAPTYGRLLAVTHPVVGNHEYETEGAAGYFGYFGARAGTPGQGWYSVDVGGWHVIALNSNCREVSCDPGSDQERWLRADLAAHPARCTLAMWHHPRWSHGTHGDDDAVQPFVDDLVAAGADVILSGHDHDYERFAPRLASGRVDTARGVREFVVGTGGRSLRDADPGEGTEALIAHRFGALVLTLTPAGYSWQFLEPGASAAADAGQALCH